MRARTTMRMIGKFLTAFVIMLCMLCTMALPVIAADENNGALTATEDPRESVMLISLCYEDDNGEYLDYKWGTCFLINDEYVLTNRHVVTIDEDEKTDADKKYLDEFKAELKVRFGVENLEPTDNHLKIYLYVNRDMRIKGTMHNSVNSKNMDFAAIKLTEKIYDRNPVVLGDSDQIQARDVVYAMGYPEDSVSDKKFNTKDDVSTVDGTISKVTTKEVDIIEHTAPLNRGNSGGPLMDANNNVIGINTFIAGRKNYSIQINAIKEGLNTFGIPYIDGSGTVSAATVDIGNEGEGETETEENVKDNSAILASLQSVVDEAKAIETSDYTEESVATLNDCIGAAEAVLTKGDAAEEAEITTATDDLNDAITGLEEKSGSNMAVIVGIIAAVVIVIIIIIVAVSSSSKKKKAAAKVSAGSSGYQGGPVPAPAPTPVSPISTPGTMPMEGAGETTLLDAGAGETTLLSGGGAGAYLLRKKNGEKVVINLQNFKIGKERKKVNYCVADNTTVSRLHCEIVKKGTDYYVVDKGSANYTYVNGVQASPHKETLLSDQSVLKLSDEEFEFHLS